MLEKVFVWGKNSVPTSINKRVSGKVVLRVGNSDVMK